MEITRDQKIFGIAGVYFFFALVFFPLTKAMASESMEEARKLAAAGNLAALSRSIIFRISCVKFLKRPVERWFNQQKLIDNSLSSILN